MQLGFVPILTLLAAYALVAAVPSSLRAYYLVLAAILAVLTFAQGVLRGFAFLIAITLVFGFYLVITAWGKAGVNQPSLILSQLLLLLLLLIIWLESTHFKRVVDENKLLKERLAELERYVGGSRVLTRNELIRMAGMIAKSCERRGDPIGLLVLRLKPFEGKVSGAVLSELGSILTESVRAEFDAVGLLNSNTLVAVLQNTRHDGVSTVYRRVAEAVLQHPRLEGSKVLEQLEVEMKEFIGNAQDLVGVLEET